MSFVSHAISSSRYLRVWFWHIVFLYIYYGGVALQNFNWLIYKRIIPVHQFYLSLKVSLFLLNLDEIVKLIKMQNLLSNLDGVDLHLEFLIQNQIGVQPLPFTGMDSK